MGILPLLFKNPSDYARISRGDTLRFPELRKALEEGKEEVKANLSGKGDVTFIVSLSQRERQYVLIGGLLNYVKKTMKPLVPA